MATVGIRDLKNQLSHHLRTVKRGQALMVTERGEVIATLIPARPSLPEGLKEMLIRGQASWGGGKPHGTARPPRIPHGQELSKAVLEDRK